MVHPEEFIGRRFERLVVAGPAEPAGNMRRWRCVCDCGAEKTARENNLVDGGTRSCGCLRNERVADALRTHGYASGPKKRTEYKTWLAMVRRCHVPADSNFNKYGGRGIAVCDRWRHGEEGKSGFQCFIEDMGDKPASRHSIERMDNEVDYTPDNCTWATSTRQVRNRRNTRRINWKGRDIPLATACELAGLPYKTVIGRICRGWSEERALSTP